MSEKPVSSKTSSVSASKSLKSTHFPSSKCCPGLTIIESFVSSSTTLIVFAETRPASFWLSSVMPRASLAFTCVINSAPLLKLTLSPYNVDVPISIRLLLILIVPCFLAISAKLLDTLKNPFEISPWLCNCKLLFIILNVPALKISSPSAKSLVGVAGYFPAFSV